MTLLMGTPVEILPKVYLGPALSKLRKGDPGGKQWIDVDKIPKAKKTASRYQFIFDRVQGTHICQFKPLDPRDLCSKTL